MTNIERKRTIATALGRGPSQTGALRHLRERNEQRVIETLRRRQYASRAEIARVTGLSRSTVSSLVADLQSRGVVVEEPVTEGERTGQAGRPPVLLSLDPTAGAALGVDFGHRHIRVAVADLSSRILAERRVEMDVDRAAPTALDMAAGLVDEVLDAGAIDRARVVGCGMGLPGPIDSRTGVVGSSVILPGWAGLIAREELGRRIRVPVEVDNDANLGALGEIAFGAGRGARHAVYLKVSSGIGAGLVLDGRIHQGATGIAGEIGHTLARPEGRVCRCGSRGCLETVAAAPALMELLGPAHGRELTTADVVALAQAGDVGTTRLLADAGRAIGRTLADLCNTINPELIIVGGELGAAGAPLVDGVRESIARYALPAAAAAVAVRAGVLGERAELLGALALVIRIDEGAGIAITTDPLLEGVTA